MRTRIDVVKKLLVPILGMVIFSMMFSPAFAQVKDTPSVADNSASANVAPMHVEVGDAGNLPGTAQDPGGAGPLTSIAGTAGGGDEDMYKICITSPSIFSATTVAMTTFDTQLFLFDSTGLGVYSNDDAAMIGAGSTLPAGDPNSPVAVGIYYLAVDDWNEEPLSVGGPIFADVFNVVNGPTGPGGASPITSWDGNTLDIFGSYTIVLTGTSATSSCQIVGGSLTPIDTTMVLVAGAQSISAWMIPVIVSGIGIAIVIARKF